VVYGRGGGCVWGESKAFIGVTVGRSDKQNNEARESVESVVMQKMDPENR
jgi:hypothetical protein